MEQPSRTRRPFLSFIAVLLGLIGILVGGGLFALTFYAGKSLPSRLDPARSALENASTNVTEVADEIDETLELVPTLAESAENAASVLRGSSALLTDLEDAGTEFAEAVQLVSRDLETLSVTLRPMMSSQNNLQQTAARLSTAATTLENALTGVAPLVEEINNTATTADTLSDSLGSFEGELSGPDAMMAVVSRHMQQTADFLETDRPQLILTVGGCAVASLFFFIGCCTFVIGLAVRR